MYFHPHVGMCGGFCRTGVGAWLHAADSCLARIGHRQCGGVAPARHAFLHKSHTPNQPIDHPTNRSTHWPVHCTHTYDMSYVICHIPMTYEL